MTGRILLVEDDPAIRQILTGLLQARGHHVEAAGDGPEALRRASHDDFDVLIMDMSLPGMTGFEVCEVLAFSGGIILMGILGELLAKESHPNIHIDFEFVKPFDPAKLIVAVDDLLQTRQT